MEQIIAKLRKNPLLPRELWEIILKFSGIYENLWKNKLQKSLKIIRNKKSLYVWSSIYNITRKYFRYLLYNPSKPNEYTTVITTYSEDKYKWEPLKIKSF
tara:strand:- start:16107 stop:16406 length:300 start_codon:yes stop_codon:yes gene_type:complete